MSALIAANKVIFSMFKEPQLQKTLNRQNSTELNMSNDDERRLAYQWENIQKGVINSTNQAYEWAISNGIAKEQARAVLPEGITMSRMYMNGTLRSWVHYIQLRSANGTQKEHREVALACADAIEPIFPMIKEFI